MTQPTSPVLPAPRLLTAVAQAALLSVLPGGGQDGGRRNARAGRSGDAARVRARLEADRALSDALVRAEATGQGTGVSGR